MRCRRVVLPLALVAAFAAACGDPPDKEIQQAQAAVESARAAGADRYATDEFTAAQDALKHANEAVAQRDYRLALNHALDARERAQNATREAADRKTTAQHDADRALATTTAALNEARVRLKAAESSRVPARVLSEARRTIAGADQALQKARAAMDRGDYLAALDDVKETTPRLQAVARDLDAATAPPARRRR